jgi:hypothetical protein
MPENSEGLDSLLKIIGSLRNCHLQNLIEVKPRLTAKDIQLIEHESQYRRIFTRGIQFPLRAKLGTSEQAPVGWFITIGEFFPERHTMSEAGKLFVPEEATYWWREESSKEYQILEPDTEVHFGEVTGFDGHGPGRKYTYAYNQEAFTVPAWPVVQ